MDPTLVPQIINALLVIGGITVGGVTLEHLLENYVMGWLPQNFKTIFPTVAAYIGTVLTRMATGTALGQALSDLPGIVLPLILAGIAHGVHGTALGATEVDVSTPTPPSATPPAPTVDVPKILILFLGLAALAGSASAATLNLGVPVTPTAGSSYIEATLVTAPSLFVLRSGELSYEPGALYGAQVTWQWGPNYGLGVDLGVNVQGAGSITDPTLGKVAVGGVANFCKLALVIDATFDGTTHAALTYSWGGSVASVQVTP